MMQEGGSAGNPTTNTKRLKDRKTHIKSPFPNNELFKEIQEECFLKRREREAFRNVGQERQRTDL